MDRKQMKRASLADASFVAILAAIALFVAFPMILIVLGGLSTPPRPGGFGQPPGTILRLSIASLSTSGLGALLAAGAGLSGSALGLGAPRFAYLYKNWLVIVPFTNPVFFVLGLSTILAEWPPFLAVVFATAYIVFPLGGLIIQSAFDEFPDAEMRAARTLGASWPLVLWKNLVPAAAPQAILAFVLMLAYALGFYLVPSYVGLGRIATLSTAVSTLAAKVGDWPAALQMSLVLLVLQLGLILIAAASLRLFRHRRSN